MVEICPMGLDGIGKPREWVLDEDVVLREAMRAIGSFTNAGHVVAVVREAVEVVRETAIPDFLLGDILGNVILSRDAGFLPNQP